MTYARLIMADQSFTTMSSFGIFPVIGGFGKGYFQQKLNMFAYHLPAYYPESLFKMDGDFKSSGTIRQMDLQSILDWLGDGYNMTTTPKDESQS
jgi:hypothetical protein